MRGRLYAIVAAGAAITLAGCSSEIDSGKLEDNIRSGLGEELAAQGGTDAVESVDCPDGEESETGNTFECTAEFVDDTSLKIEAEVTDGDNGDVRWDAVAP